MNHPALTNYYQVVAKVDALCRDIARAVAERLTCTAGCSSCCLPITLFPVEAAALVVALEQLSLAERQTIIDHVRQWPDQSRCPLLKDDRCLLYHARPLICRTHGLPVLFQEEGQRRLDYCPRNDFSGLALSGSRVIDLEQLNSLLVAVNVLFCRETNRAEQGAERIRIRDVVMGETV